MILRDRSPLATAVVTSAMLRTWPVRLAAIEFTSRSGPSTCRPRPARSAWPPSLPSVPTSRATRVTSEANERSWSTIVLMVSFSCRISPRTSTVILRDRSPFATAVVTSAMLRTWPVRLLAIEFTLSVRSFHVPATPGTSAWPPSLPSVPTSRATRVTSAAKAFSWSTIVLMVFFSSQNFALHVHRDLARQVAARHGRRHFGDVAHLAGQVAWPSTFTLSVRSFHVPATPGTTAWPPSLPSVPTSRATRVTSEANERSWSTIVLMASFSCRISPRTSTVILRDKSPFATAVVTSAMLRTWPVRLPAIEFTLSVRSFHVPARAWHRRLAAELAFGADFARHARHFGGERAHLLDHRVDDGRGAQELALERTAVDFQAHALRKIALGDRGDRARHFGGRPQQVVDQRVDGGFHRAPRARAPIDGHAVARPAFFADHLAGALDLARHALVRRDDLIECVGDFAGEAGLVAGQAHGEIAVAHRLQCAQQLAQIQIRIVPAWFAIGTARSASDAFLSFHLDAPTGSDVS